MKSAFGFQVKHWNKMQTSRSVSEVANQAEDSLWNWFKNYFQPSALIFLNKSHVNCFNLVKPSIRRSFYWFLVKQSSFAQLRNHLKALNADKSCRQRNMLRIERNFLRLGANHKDCGTTELSLNQFSNTLRNCRLNYNSCK